MVNSNQFIRHELKTPIGTIKGYISMLEEGDYGELNLTEEQKIIFQKIKVNLESLIEKTNTLLPDPL